MSLTYRRRRVTSRKGKGRKSLLPSIQHHFTALGGSWMPDAFIDHGNSSFRSRISPVPLICFVTAWPDAYAVPKLQHDGQEAAKLVAHSIQ